MAGIILEEYELLGDVRYRSYVSVVDKALKSFEYTSEWADLISALAKLNKVLLSHTKFQVIPRRITISKRLAQCMHPALPSGVHLKALETYDIIFKCIGSARLSQELFIYSAGLFPLLANAAMNVKPSLLTIYETHFIPLEEKLRPGLNGFLIGVLPGLDEGSDYYERTDTLLQNICNGVERSFFYGCMWKCILSNPIIRLPAITFIISHFSRKQSTEDQIYIIGTDIDSMVHGLCSSLQDGSILVQRCALDLLLIGFPIHNNQLVASDMVLIVTAAVTVVLRRDMSLNRRLFAWLLGGDSGNTSDTSDPVSPQESGDECSYFKTYSKDLLLQALRVCIHNPMQTIPVVGVSSGSPDLLCYRLLISLLDRPDISSIILDDILIEVFRSLHFQCEVQQGLPSNVRNSLIATSSSRSELIKTANLFFATLEPWYLWAYSAKLFRNACQHSPVTLTAESLSNSIDLRKTASSKPPSLKEMCTLLEFLLDVVSLETYLEARSEHLPELMCQIADALAMNCEKIVVSDLSLALNLCSKILSKVQAPMIDIDNISKASKSLKSKSSDRPIHFGESPSVKVDAIKLEPPVTEEEPDLRQCLPPNLTTSITNCMTKYELLLVSFLKSKLLCDPNKTLQHFDLLLLPKEPSREQKEDELKSMLETSLCAKSLWCEDVKVFDGIIKNDMKENQNLLLEKTIPSSDALNEAFKRLCHIIIELSSFPIYCTNSKKVFENNFNELDAMHLPEWLKLLTSLACFGDSDEVVFTSMSTIFELISLTQSMGINSDESSPQCPEKNESKSVVSVVSIPLLTSSHLAFLLEETLLYKTAVIKLWKFVDDHMQHYCLRASELIQKIHSLSLSSLVCEEVICDSMSSGTEMEQLHSQKKFCILWHLTRDLTIKSTPASVKTFDQCFFQMIDNLAKETGPQKAIAQSWLNHSLQRGDIARFMEPILMILLHPDSARVSIQHVSVRSPRKISVANEAPNYISEEPEAKIYAISSISGNVIYHVSDDSHSSSQHVSPQKISTFTTVVNPDGNKLSEVITHKSSIKEYELPACHERNLHVPISLFVNPFGSMSSLCSDSQLESVTNVPPDFSEVTRFQPKYSFEQEDDSESVKSVPCTLEQSTEEIVSDVLNEIVDFIVKSSTKHSSSYAEEEYNFDKQLNGKNVALALQSNAFETNPDFTEVTIHPIHSYMLLYCQVYDSKKTLYALHSLKSIILTNPRITLCSMATTNINNYLSSRGQQLQFLLARHRKSIFGNNFHGELSAEGTTPYRSSTFLETILLTCLHHIRSYYPNLAQMKLTDEEVLCNREVRLLCMEVLTLMFMELIAILKDSGKNFASYLNDLLVRSKVQKSLLHCLVGSVYDSQHTENESRNKSFTETIVEFNDKEVNPDGSLRGRHFQDTFQVHLLHLIATLIVVEDTLNNKTVNDKDPRAGSTPKSSEFTFDPSSHPHQQSRMTSIKYQQGLPIPAQPMFLNAVLTALDDQHNRQMHIHWLSLVTSTLPFAGRWLARLIMTVIIQLCFNLEVIASICLKLNKDENYDASDDHMPPDYLINIIDGLTTLCHYCLLECPPMTNLFNPSLIQPSQAYVTGTSTSQIISNLIHVFSTSSSEKDNTPTNESSNSIDRILSARRSLLSNLPSIISSVTAVYRAASVSKKNENGNCWILGSPKVVKLHILSFLSPISLNFGSNFMAALAVVWHEQRIKTTPQTRKVIPSWSPEQLLLVDLLTAIKVLPIESIVQTVRNVLKQPPITSHKHKVHIEACTLQLFLAYIQNTSASYLIESWPSLLSLWRDGLQLSSPPVNFHLLALLHEFVQRASILEDKKSQKDLQDIAHKLIEACSTAASASLEQTTWLWRNLAVRPGPQTDIIPTDADDDTSPSNNQSIDSGIQSNGNSASCCDAQYSVQALTVLAEFLAPVLDYVYIGEEKDKVVPLLSNIMYYVTPYLKNHSSHNAPSFRSCCQLLSSISGYQHTRKAWRKDVFELLLDMSFFQMSSPCVSHWRAIIDHLMTHDKTTFRDFMSRVSVAQSGSLSLFSSKEQEYEQRAQLLKRLAFVLFCSELDQYQKCMPDIQERLTECLRLHHVPSVHAEVFLCFRVLLIRMSAHHVTSLWPVIITEMVQIFTQMECELCTDSEEFSSHLRRLSTLDSTWVTNSLNGLNAHNNPSWLHLYLSVCKLLDMAVALPANVLPQFQMYRWAFVGDSPPLLTESEEILNSEVTPLAQEFVPHVTRLAKLLNKKELHKDSVSSIPGQLLITVPRIYGIQDLQLFFNALSNISSKKAFQSHSTESLKIPYQESKSSPISKCRSAPDLHGLNHDTPLPARTCKNNSIIEQIEMVLENDFIEPLVD